MVRPEMEERFFVESVYRRFDAAIDRIDSKERSPTRHEADSLIAALNEITAGNYARASELLDELKITPAASDAVDDGATAELPTTRQLRDRLRVVRTKPM